MAIAREIFFSFTPLRTGVDDSSRMRSGGGRRSPRTSSRCSRRAGIRKGIPTFGCGSRGPRGSCRSRTIRSSWSIRWSATITRVSTWRSLLGAADAGAPPPPGWIRSRLEPGVIGAGMSPISSRNRVPPWASSNLPTLRATAPVKAPFSWPNSSDSISSSGIAAQFTSTKGPSLRRLRAWICRATSSLPVPFSPVISTQPLLGAATSICSMSRATWGELPTISWARRASARSSWFSRSRRECSRAC